jgi:alcohol dehydrogenase class IV
VCAALLAPVVEANVRVLRERDAASPALRRYAEVARLLTGRDDATIEDGVDWLRETVTALRVPPLDTVGLQPGQYPEVAEKAARSSSMQGNPVPLSGDQLVAVLRRSHEL